MGATNKEGKGGQGKLGIFVQNKKGLCDQAGLLGRRHMEKEEDTSSKALANMVMKDAK